MTPRTEQPLHTPQSKLRHAVYLTAMLFLFWVILSGKMEAKYLIIGLVSAVGITAVTWRFLLFPWCYGEGCLRSAWDQPWFRLMAYFPWLLWQIVKANLEVAWVILHPRLPIQPQMVRFSKPLPGPVAHLVLVNSITLTPGTVTVDIEGDEYVVHALLESGARSLVPESGEGGMQRRVAAIFRE